MPYNLRSNQPAERTIYITYRDGNESTVTDRPPIGVPANVLVAAGQKPTREQRATAARLASPTA